MSKLFYRDSKGNYTPLSLIDDSHLINAINKLQREDENHPDLPALLAEKDRRDIPDKEELPHYKS